MASFLLFLNLCGCDQEFYVIVEVPGAPSTPSVSNITGSSMTVSWLPPENNGGALIEGYWLEMKDSDSARWRKVSRTPVAASTKSPCLYKVSRIFLKPIPAYSQRWWLTSSK